MVREYTRPLAWVTGATSFLGRHVARALNQRGYEVAGFARTLGVEPELTSQWGFHSVECGAFDAGLIRRAFERRGFPAVVFHAIGSGSIAQASADPAADKERTLLTTECLTTELRRAVSPVRLIYPSSAAVYGVTIPGPISENAPTAPISEYGANKLQAEAICRAYAERSGQQAVVIRFFSVYGAPQRKLLLWELGRRLLAGERMLRLGGTGEETRDFIHVSDATALVATLAASANPPSLLNAGTGRPTHVKTLANLWANALGVAAEIRFDGKVRHGNPPYQQADVSRRARVGFKAFVPLELGLIDYARWLRSETSKR